MRRRGLEPPRAIRSQGPQPCASTNSATGAWASQHIRRLPLASVRGPRYLPEHMFPSPSVRSDDVDLTKRQQEIFDFIKKYSAKHGYPPTVRDIGKAVGLASSSTVHAHLANLEKVGLLRRGPPKPRAPQLPDPARPAGRAGPGG